MNIYVASKKSKIENLQKKYPSALIIDITSTAEYGGLRILSPFYPHMNIPIPGMKGKYATCVEAIWQGLKVFEFCGVDYELFHNNTMKNLKRSVRKYGKPLGHQFENKLLSYEDARWLVYLPSYLYVLENVEKVQIVLNKIREQLKKQDIVFLDYNTNCNIADYSKPLSHAGLVKLYLENKYPKIEDRTSFESENKPRLLYYDIDSLVNVIQNHKKFNIEKHSIYIEQIKSLQHINIKYISSLNGKKRDGWKSIIDDIQKKQKPQQLTLFDLIDENKQ